MSCFTLSQGKKVRGRKRRGEEGVRVRERTEIRKRKEKERGVRECVPDEEDRMETCAHRQTNQPFYIRILDYTYVYAGLTSTYS